MQLTLGSVSNAMESILRENHDSPPDLERLCVSCGGKGVYEGGGRSVACHSCGGSGWETTEFGERVLELMRHNFKPMLRDAGYD
jgi:hypothetical protein